MLTIRREQMHALSAYMRQSFEDRMVRYLARAFPDEINKVVTVTGNDSKIRTLIASGIAKARHYNITSERDIVSYIEFMVVAGADFESRPDFKWAQAILADAALSGHGKATLLERRLPEFRTAHRSTEPLSREL